MNRPLTLALLIPLVGILVWRPWEDEAPPLPEGPRVFVAIASLDGALPEGMEVVRVDAERMAYPLVAVVDGGDEFVAAGAPRGDYEIRAPGGWGHIGVQGPVELVPGGAPAGMRIGAPHTIYVASPTPGVRPDLRWAIARPSSPEEAIPIEVEGDRSDAFVALRVPAEAWSGEVLLAGWFRRDGEAGGAGTLPAAPRPVELRPDRPALALVPPAAGLIFDVELVPATADAKIEGVPVRLSVPGLPLSIVRDAQTGPSGAVRFSVPGMNRPVRIEVGERSFTLDPERVASRVRLAVLVSDGWGDPVHLHEFSTDLPLEVEARPEGGTTYGVVDTERHTADLVEVPIPDVPVSLLIRQGERVGVVDRPTVVRARDVLHEAVRIAGTVDGLVGPGVVRFLRIEDGEPRGAASLETRAGPSGNYEVLVPMGTYAVEVVGPHGTWSRPQPVEAPEPGGRIHLPLAIR